MKLLFRPTLHGPQRVILREQLQQRAARLFDFRRVGFDLHPVSCWRGTRRNELLDSLHPHQAETARARRLEAIVVAKRWHFNTGPTRGFENTRASRDIRRP